MPIVKASDFRDGFSDTLDRVEHHGERVTIERHGKPAAVLVSIADAEMLREIEDRFDVETAEAVRARGEGTVPWDQVSRELAQEDLTTEDLAKAKAFIGRSVTANQWRAALMELTDDEREVVVLRSFHGKTHREIAEQLGVHASTVARRRASATNKMAGALSRTRR
ncbi:MAG: type II toxin-antitoxin system prevent-host-death family antitoxin [Planctomycetes bacterium]|nr:type II toxin-antitoxin system prevent-host-death family antitoxin [Planctomycetota bacterium]